MYLFMLVVGLLMMIVFTAIGFVAIGVSTAAELPYWLSQLIMWVGLVVLMIFIIFVCVMRFRGWALDRK